MSDEEKKAVDKIKTLIQYLNVWKENFTIVPEDVKYLVTILNLIEKQSKEIEELKTTKKELTERVLRLESDKFWDNVVSKDKIKAKIEELENEKEKYFEKQVIQHEIEILQSLLEKE